MYGWFLFLFCISSNPDVDECTSKTDNCHTNAACINTVGNFTCTCNGGYNGDGVNCTGKFQIEPTPKISMGPNSVNPTEK